jgi:hypothetical protein
MALSDFIGSSANPEPSGFCLASLGFGAYIWRRGETIPNQTPGNRHSFISCCQIKENRMKTLFLLAGSVVLCNAVIGAEMSAGEIIKKSQAAYASVKTYVGTTTVRGKSEVGQMNLEQTSMAKVTFARPGKIHIAGKTASAVGGKAGHPFTIVSDGKTTWRSWALQNKGAFEPVRSVSGAGMAGVAQGAAEMMAAALMKADGTFTGGADPFIVAQVGGSTLEGHENIDGADCYKLGTKSPIHGDVILWVDSKSFFLRQMMRSLNANQLAEQRKAAEAAMKKAGKEMPVPPVEAAVKSMVHVSSFKTDQVNGEVDEKLFADPTRN